MRRLARRTVALLLVVALFVAGFGIFTVRFVVNGGQWAAFRPNLHTFAYGVLTRGTVTDRDGYPLSWPDSGVREYCSIRDIRMATLHVVGDLSGNIGTGLLKTYERQLMGYDLLNGLYSFSDQGNTLVSTLDASLCATALGALGSRKGTVVVYNYQKGDILCMVSTPTFDPLHAPSTEDIEGNDYYDGVYLNRALSSSFAPGSIFKLVTLAAAVETLPELWDMEFECSGSITIEGDRISCNGVHGKLKIEDALGASCNVAFSQLALLLGGDRLAAYARSAGLLDPFACSRIPVAGGSFRIAADGSANLAWSGIGQYQDLVNPLAAARLAGAIANHGIAVDPRLVERITNYSGLPVRLIPRSGQQRLLSADTADTLCSMMRYSVTSWYGGWRFPGLTVAAKSGTAEAAEDKPPHAWFVGFLDDPDHPLAFAVFVENGGWGLDVAGQITNIVLQKAVRLEL